MFVVITAGLILGGRNNIGQFKHTKSSKERKFSMNINTKNVRIGLSCE